jgi:acetyl esterase
MTNSILDEDCAKLLQGVASQGGLKFRDLSPEVARAAVASMTEFDLPCAAPCTVENIPASGSRVASRLYLPRAPSAGASAEPVIVYLHGGGWVVGTLDTYDALCRHLATRSGCRVLSVEYRLAPEHPFPAAYDDTLAIIRWLEQSPKELRHPVSAMALAGDSAGGELAAAAALESTSRGGRLRAILLLYPVTDISRSHPSYELFAENYLLLADDMRYFAECYAPTAELRRDPRVSPLLASDLSRLPPTTLLTCGFDVLRDEGRALGARLVQAGVELAYLEASGHIHGIATLRAAIPSARAPIDRAIDAFIGQLGQRPDSRTRP